MIFNIINPIIALGEANFTNMPYWLMVRLQLPNLFVANLLGSLIILLMILIPCIVFGQTLMGIFLGNIILFVCVAIGWLDAWILFFQIMLVAGLLTFRFIGGMWD